jgi:hypothetical protein
VNFFYSSCGFIWENAGVFFFKSVNSHDFSFLFFEFFWPIFFSQAEEKKRKKKASLLKSPLFLLVAF